ncbi:hypothetical protein CHUAL_013864 [Chamberlinius hualienensis]
MDVLVSIIIAAVAVTGLLLAFIDYICCKRRKKNTENDEDWEEDINSCKVKITSEKPNTVNTEDGKSLDNSTVVDIQISKDSENSKLKDISESESGKSSTETNCNKNSEHKGECSSGITSVNDGGECSTGNQSKLYDRKSQDIEDTN